MHILLVAMNTPLASLRSYPTRRQQRRNCRNAIDKFEKQHTLPSMKLRHVIVAVTLVLAVVTGGAIAGAMMLPAAAGAEVELSSLERKIRDIDKKLARMSQQLEDACVQQTEEASAEALRSDDRKIGPPDPSI